ncbi:hypothetical protein AJ79_07188 [Helicocarpus griseus UAMH5409]|uniref:Uncharacterized protein n=1 Tax=Helicocarpus griseus UAMH5409 TaxID=1447875 RepID=A0A2B7X5Z3_9EURO|nr:hypothetical protein AJ79_07188 [Helicocarpus griseus UAMH5409]
MPRMSTRKPDTPSVNDSGLGGKPGAERPRWTSDDESPHRNEGAGLAFVGDRAALSAPDKDRAAAAMVLDTSNSGNGAIISDNHTNKEPDVYAPVR